MWGCCWPLATDDTMTHHERPPSSGLVLASRIAREKKSLRLDRCQDSQVRDAVRKAGGEPVEVSLGLSTEELARLAETLNGVALSGSPADISPSLFHAEKHPQTAAGDAERERTDFALLEHCLRRTKPVLAICYGIQSLNVFLGGTLVQDIPGELHTEIQHDWDDDVESRNLSYCANRTGLVACAHGGI